MTKNQLGLLLRLPRSPNVNEILVMYYQLKIESSPEQQGIYGEIVDGIKVYFDFLVGDQLLYESELTQHFARLFVHLPEFMGKAEIPRKHNLLISSHIQDMIDYITSNLARFQEAAIYEEPTEQNPHK